MSRFSTLAIASALLGSAAMMPTTADAALFQFFDGVGTAYTGPFDTGVVDQFLGPTATTATGGGACAVGSGGAGDDVCGASLGFSSGGFSLTATATNLGGGASGIVDRDPNFGGLGVLDTSPSDINDHVNGLNALTLTFTSPVTITGIATLFDPDHGPFGNPVVGSAPFLMTIGANSLVPVAGLTFASVNAGGLALTGTVFNFAQNLLHSSPEFYISGLQVVPLPGAALLFGTALAGLGWMRRRRNGGKSEAVPA